MMFEDERKAWNSQITEWMHISEKEKQSKDPMTILRCLLLTGQAEEAFPILKECLSNRGKSSYFSISTKDSGGTFHLGHYLVVCNSILLFECFKEHGGFSWSSPKLPIHLALSLPKRAQWVPILAPLSGSYVNCWGVNGLNIAQWAVSYHCSLGPIIQNNLWPPNQSFPNLLIIAKREGNKAAASLLTPLCEEESMK